MNDKWIQDEKYKCEECGLKFRTNLAFKYHKKEHEIIYKKRS